MGDPARTCRNCNRPITGRKDKKFCNRMCKADYHQDTQTSRFLDQLGSKDILNYV